MKKIVTGFVALAMAASMFAVDFSARVVMEGTLASGEKDKDTKVLTLNEKEQKDADALVVSVNGEKAGAQFQLWYNYNGGKGIEAKTTYDADKKEYSTALTHSILQVRGTSLWFKPFDMLKVTVGNMSVGTYKNHLDWWKDPAGASYEQAAGWDNGYSSFATVEGEGFGIDLTPIDGLLITAGVAPGAGSTFFTKPATGDSTYAAWGAGAQYSNIAGLPLSAAITYRDAGKDAAKVLAIGADYGNAWGAGFYGMVNARMYFDDRAHAYWGDDADGIRLAGIAIDNYFRFQAGALVAQFRAPVVIRGLTEFKESWGPVIADPSYMYYSGKVEYALSAFTPYFMFGSDVAANMEGVKFDDFGKTFNIDIQPGVTVNVGACALDVAVRISVLDEDAAGNRAIQWSLPFTASVAF